MGTEFQFYKVKRALGGCWMHIMSALNTTELYTSRQLDSDFYVMCICGVYLHITNVCVYYTCLYMT